MLKLTGYFTGFSSRNDRSAGLRFATQELTPEQYAELQRQLNNFGWIIFKENEIELADIPKEDADEKMSPSQEQRWLLRKYHKQNGGKEEGFNSFYREYMAKSNANLRAKIEAN